MSYITAIGTANPDHRFSQATIADFMLQRMKLNNGDSRKLKTIFKVSGIQYRHTVLEDYGKTEDFTFYPAKSNSASEPSTLNRLEIFRKNAAALSEASVKELKERYPHFRANEITHLVVVCCTGMYAPGLDIDIVKRLGLRTTVHRTAINFMGCYAAFNALKVADAFCQTDAASKVLIVCTELCSLHFQREGTDDNLLANALFGDGSAALLVEARSESRLKLKIEQFHSDLASESEEYMAWTVGDLGFEMKLSAYVPDIIKGGISALTNSLLKKISKTVGDIRHFAIHPGGKKILEVIEQELGISHEQNASAYRVLQQYGNMSSPTVLFVLKDVVENLKKENAGDYILSFAFGPGLTLESMVLRIERS